MKDADHNGKITTKCLTAFLYSYKLNSFIYFFINLFNLAQIKMSIYEMNTFEAKFFE